MKTKSIIFIAIAVAVGLLVLLLIGSYSSLVGKDERVKETTGNVQSSYQRRLDLIPNLVNVVKGYASHEKEVFTNVTEARAKVAQVNVAALPGNIEAQKEFATANQALSGSLSRLIAVAEAYPALKADGVFRDLQSQIEGTENRINVARNDRAKAVREYNSARRSISGKLVQIVADFPVAAQFEADTAAQKAPEVKF